MRPRACAALASLALLVATLPAAHPPRTSDSACTIVARPWLRHERATYFTLTATSDSVAAGTWTARSWDVPSPPPAPHTATPVVVYGQVVRLDTVRGPFAARLAPAQRRAVLISWGSGGMCDLLPTGRALGIPPGERAFLELGPRPDSAWVQGMPTFDRGIGIRRYAPAEYDRHHRPTWWARLLKPRPMTLDEYFQMYEALPPADLWETDAAAASRIVYRWARTHPRAAEREPARTMIQAMRRELRQRRDDGDST